jgi:hypothetical protein
MVPPPRPLVRHDQLRVTEPIDGGDDFQFSKGRYFVANCLAADDVEHCVYITGAEVISIPQVATVDITKLAKMPAVGMIVEKSSPTDCIVQVLGETSLITTTPGLRHFIGFDGKPTATVPVAAPGGTAILQVIGMAIGSSRLLLRVDQQMVLTYG